MVGCGIHTAKRCGIALRYGRVVRASASATRCRCDTVPLRRGERLQACYYIWRRHLCRFATFFGLLRFGGAPRQTVPPNISSNTVESIRYGVSLPRPPAAQPSPHSTWRHTTQLHCGTDKTIRSTWLADQEP
jgi:hypothetical protein